MCLAQSYFRREIGGVKEKLLGAHRAGIREIVIPFENEADLEDLPDSVGKELTVHCVEELDQVMDVALVPEEKARRSAPRRRKKAQETEVAAP